MNLASWQNSGLWQTDRHAMGYSHLVQYAYMLHMHHMVKILDQHKYLQYLLKSLTTVYGCQVSRGDDSEWTREAISRRPWQLSMCRQTTAAIAAVLPSCEFSILYFPAAASVPSHLQCTSSSAECTTVFTTLTSLENYNSNPSHKVSQKPGRASLFLTSAYYSFDSYCTVPLVTTAQPVDT